MDIKDFFAEVGGNYEDVLARLMSGALIKKFVIKFANDPSYARLKTALEENNLREAFLAVHTIKGTAANLGLDNLANAASALTEELRDARDIPNIKYIEAVDEAYKATVEKIGLID